LYRFIKNFRRSLDRIVLSQVAVYLGLMQIAPWFPSEIVMRRHIFNSASLLNCDEISTSQELLRFATQMGVKFADARKMWIPDASAKKYPDRLHQKSAWACERAALD